MSEKNIIDRSAGPLTVASLTEYLRRCGRVVGRISNLDSTLFTLLANGHPLNLTQDEPAKPPFGNWTADCRR